MLEACRPNSTEANDALVELARSRSQSPHHELRHIDVYGGTYAACLGKLDRLYDPTTTGVFGEKVNPNDDRLPFELHDGPLPGPLFRALPPRANERHDASDLAAHALDSATATRSLPSSSSASRSSRFSPWRVASAAHARPFRSGSASISASSSAAVVALSAAANSPSTRARSSVRQRASPSPESAA